MRLENLTLTNGAAINATGNALANMITGNAAANTLEGDAGNDTLVGGSGNDLYLFNTGFGQDTVIDTDATGGNQDIVRFGAGITPDLDGVSRSGRIVLPGGGRDGRELVARMGQMSGGIGIARSGTVAALQSMAAATRPDGIQSQQTKAYTEGAASIALDDIVVTDRAGDISPPP